MRKNKMRFLLRTLVLMVICAGCNNTPTTLVDKVGGTLKPESIEYKQTGIIDTTINYCYYLPSLYNGSKKLPVLFFLDPHANGKLPIEKYAALANQYGYIFIASNNLKNGLSAQQSQQFFKNLLSEIKHRFVIDQNRMFVAGFSGGAKLAIMFAQQIPEIIGVAACGGSIPLSKTKKPSYYYVGMVGNQDFNFLEVQQATSIFDQLNFDFTSVIFNGAHEWPPVESFEMGLIGFNIYALKTKRTEKDSKWIDEIWNRMNDSISHYNKTNDIINENIYLSQAQRWFYGLKNAVELKKRSIEISQSSNFKNHINKQQKLIQTEVKLRSAYVKAIELRDTNWWESEIEKIKSSIQQNNKEVGQVSQRLLNYLSMASFMLTKNDLNNLRLVDAQKKIKIYELVDPDNPDVYLMYARYFMLINDTKAMQKNLNKAQELGFTDYETYVNDPFWKPLLNQKELNQ